MELKEALVTISQQVRTLALVVEQLERDIQFDEGDSPTTHGRDVAVALKALEQRLHSEPIGINGGEDF